MNADFISAIQELGKEKGIDPELLFQAVDDALVAAYKKNTGTNQNVRVEMNKETGEITYQIKRKDLVPISFKKLIKYQIK